MDHIFQRVPSIILQMLRYDEQTVSNYSPDDSFFFS